MSLKNRIESDVAVFLNPSEFGKAVSYNGREIVAVVDEDGWNLKGNSFATEGRSAMAHIWISVSDVPEPSPGDEIRGSDGTLWRYARTVERNSAMLCIECLAEESPW